MINLTVADAENLMKYINACEYHAQHDEFDNDRSSINTNKLWRDQFAIQLKQARIDNKAEHHMYLVRIEKSIINYLNTYKTAYHHPKLEYITTVLADLIRNYGEDLVKQKQHLHHELPKLIEVAIAETND